MTPLVAAQLFNDPRLVEAKRFIREAFGEHQAKLSGVRPPSADFSADYHSTIEAFGQARGGNLLFSYIGSGVGAGALVELGDGSVKYDSPPVSFQIIHVSSVPISSSPLSARSRPLSM